jgi:glycosyltransferase involved in cell wall biosynthesis
MNDNPLVSIIIPVYNGEHYLSEAIESVLVQDYNQIEVIVVDDGSTDDSAAIVKNYEPLRYCFQPHGGIGTALNHGIKVARGSFFAFLDADDLWTNNKLISQMTVFKNNPKLDIVFGHVVHFFGHEMDEETRRTLKCSNESMPGYCKGSMVIRREAFLSVGPFATNWKLGDFFDWYLRAMEKGLKSLMLPEVVLRRRIHSSNKVIRDRNHQTDYIRILKAALDRQRHRDA